MHSDYIVFVDESGDHGLASIDPNYPMFVLAFCVFRKDQYAAEVKPAVANFKFRHFGHDLVILHEHEIRKARPPFDILLNPARREPFYRDLNELMERAPFTIIASAIRKDQLREMYLLPDNPYHLALAFGLERLMLHLRSLGVPAGFRTHVIFECRGAKEDAELELEFRRICDGGNALREWLPLEIVFAEKKCNSSGLQVADLVARPIGRKILAPAQPNRAYDILERKLRRSEGGRVEGWGLKVFL